MTDVGIFAPIYPPQTGGAAVYFSQVKRVLEDTEYTPHILTTTNATGGERVYSVFPEGLIHGAAFVPEAYQLLRRHDFDLLHVHPHFPQWRFHRWVASLFDVPTVYDCRDRLYKPQFVDGGDHYLSAAGHIDGLLDRQGVHPSNITRSPVVMPDVEPVVPLARDGDRHLAVFIGDLTAAKGLPHARNAVGMLDGVDLHVAGDGPHRQGLEQDGADWLTYWGSLPHHYALGLIDMADVLVLPSECEGRPRVILEALSLGTPVVTTKAANLSGLVDGAGVIVKRKAGSVAEGVRDVLDTPRYAERARARDVGGTESELREGLVSGYEAALTTT